MTDKIIFNLPFPPLCGILCIGGINTNESHREAEDIL